MEAYLRDVYATHSIRTSSRKLECYLEHWKRQYNSQERFYFVHDT